MALAFIVVSHPPYKVADELKHSHSKRGPAMKKVICACIPLVLIAGLAALAPADDGKPVEVAGGGRFIDPEGDCKLRQENGKWLVDVPGVYHDLWPKKGKVNAPRILRDVEGDFTAQVKIPGMISAEKGSAIPGLASSAAFRAGSLLIWQDENNFARMDRAGMNKDGKDYSFCYYHIFKDGDRIVQESRALKNIDTDFRLERRGGKIKAAYSQDGGKSWRSLSTKNFEFKGKLEAGVAVLNTTNKPLTVEFAGFSVSPIRK